MKKRSLTFLVTAGPTVEDIDPVRYITNRATGTLGFATARAVLNAGHYVILIHGPVDQKLYKNLPSTVRLRRQEIRSSQDMYDAVMSVEAAVDVVVMTAAVADFTPAHPSGTKIKKKGSRLVLPLKPTRDILKVLGRQKRLRPKNNPLTLIGFALETGQGKTSAARQKSKLAEARRKLIQKNLDAVVMDDPPAFAAKSAKFTILFRDDNHIDQGQWTKVAFARRLVQLGETLSPAYK